jgi:hypothetical protein
MRWHVFAHVNKSRELDRLVGRVEQLLDRLPADPSAEINALRDKVDRTILATWLALGSEPARTAPRHHQQGALKIAVTLLVGIVAGSLVRRRL